MLSISDCNVLVLPTTNDVVSDRSSTPQYGEVQTVTAEAMHQS
jgi:hypothetical protein